MKRREFIGAAAAASVALPGVLRSERTMGEPRPRRSSPADSLGGVPLDSSGAISSATSTSTSVFSLATASTSSAAGSCAAWTTTGRSSTRTSSTGSRAGASGSFSHLYLHFGKNPRYLEVARKTCDFMLRYFPQDKERMRWATVVARDGTVVQGYDNDPFGCYFGIEGMFELAAAAGDEKLFAEALELYLRHYRFVRDPGTSS